MDSKTGIIIIILLLVLYVGSYAYFRSNRLIVGMNHGCYLPVGEPVKPCNYPHYAAFDRRCSEFIEYVYKPLTFLEIEFRKRFD